MNLCWGINLHDGDKRQYHVIGISLFYGAISWQGVGLILIQNIKVITD